MGDGLHIVAGLLADLLRTCEATATAGDGLVDASHALARLGELFGGELFVRQPHGLDRRRARWLSAQLSKRGPVGTTAGFAADVAATRNRQGGAEVAQPSPAADQARRRACRLATRKRPPEGGL
jgi:hypothetical protein